MDRAERCPNLKPKKIQILKNEWRVSQSRRRRRLKSKHSALVLDGNPNLILRWNGQSFDDDNDSFNDENVNELRNVSQDNKYLGSYLKHEEANLRFVKKQNIGSHVFKKQANLSLFYVVYICKEGIAGIRTWTARVPRRLLGELTKVEQQLVNPIWRFLCSRIKNLFFYVGPP